MATLAVRMLDLNHWLESHEDVSSYRYIRRVAHALSGTGDEMMFSS